ncbi:uncharacterized protein [Solanum lycopersicum]|uniref:uncharacterized protein n=1 Tax=Solanum lycopersicum TaxID=4081 RepID=UPI0037491524
MVQIRTELGLVLKHVTGGPEKINAFNYFAKPPHPNDECYYAEDTYAVNEQTGGFRPSTQGLIQDNWHQGQGNQGRNYGNYNREGHYVRDGSYNRDNNFNKGNYAYKNNRNEPYVPPQNREDTSRDGGDSMARVKDMLHKIMRSFDASDEHINELRGDLASIGQKDDTHAILIKHIELQMAQLSATVNTWQPGTIPSNTFQNPNNNVHYMAITTRGDKKTIDPPMPSTKENVRKDNDNVVKGSGEAEECNRKDAEVPMKVIPMPRPPPPFPQRLVRKNEDGRYRCFITMLKKFSINVPLVDALEQVTGYAKFMKDLVTKKRSITFEDDDRLQHCSAIATRSLVQKKEYSGAFTIPCTVGSLHFAKALCDLRATINLMPLSIYKKLGLGDPKSTTMRLLMDDRIVKRPIGIVHDVLVKVESFNFPADFVIPDCEVDF